MRNNKAMHDKKIINMFIIFLFAITNVSTYPEVSEENSNRLKWPGPEDHILFRYTKSPCGFRSLYYLLCRMEKDETLSDSQKHAMLKIKDQISLREMVQIAKEVNLSLTGYEIDFNSFSRYPVMIALIQRVEQESGHFVVVEKIPQQEKWAVTDWPLARYVLSSDALQKQTKGIVLIPKETVVYPTSGPILITDMNEIDVGDHIKGKKIDISYEIVNVGNRNLEIKKLDTSCGCSKATMTEQTVSPQKHEFVDVEIIQKERTGDWREQVFLETNDPFFPYPIVSMKGNCKSLYSIDPETLIFAGDRLMDSLLIDRTLSIECFTDRDLQPEDFSVEFLIVNPFSYQLDYSLLSFEKDGFEQKLEYRFIVSTDLILPFDLHGIIVIKNTKNSDISIPVPFVIQPPAHLAVRPQPLILRSSGQFQDITLTHGGVAWNKAALGLPNYDKKIDILKSTDNEVTINIPFIVNTEDNIVIIEIIDENQSICIGIPFFDL